MALLTLPYLGAASFWDEDEGEYSETAREMLESGNGVVPTLNGQLFAEKPIMLYWLEMTAYHIFGINEFAARLPSALAAMAAVLLTYELARRMFDGGTAFSAALMLSCSTIFYASSRFVSTDALLIAFTTLTFLFFWRGFSCREKHWPIAMGISTGLALLTKGLIGILLPGAAICLFLWIIRQLHRLYDRQILLGFLVCIAIALPWYAMVEIETYGVFLRDFFIKQHIQRFFDVVQNHSGSWYYYIVVVVLGFAPWSVFLGPAAYYSIREIRNASEEREGEGKRYALLLLLCWIMVYFLFFTMAKTKLPNYVSPIYPPLAIVTAHFLERWRHGRIVVPRWAALLCLGCVSMMGIAVVLAGLVLADVHIDPWFLHGHRYPGLEMVSWLGGIVIAGAGLAWWQCRRTSSQCFIMILAATTMIFDMGLTAWDANVLDHYKAPRTLAQAVKSYQTDPYIRVACYKYFQPSLVFYLGRNVSVLHSDGEALDFLRTPLNAYLVMPLEVWEKLQHRFPVTPHLLAMHYDFVDRTTDAVVISNAPHSGDVNALPDTHPVKQVKPTLPIPPLQTWEKEFGEFIYLALFGFYASGR